MSELSNKASYLKGLADGMKLDTEKNEGKLLSEIIDFLSMVSEKIELIDDEQGFIADKLDEMEEVIDIIGESVYGDDDCDCDCDDECFSITCEKCGEEFEIMEEDLMDGSVFCPGCGEEIIFDFDCDCDCGCEDCDCE